MSSVSDYAFVSKAVDLFNSINVEGRGAGSVAQRVGGPRRRECARRRSIAPVRRRPQSRPGALERGPTEREPCSVPCVAMKV